MNTKDNRENNSTCSIYVMNICFFEASEERIEHSVLTSGTNVFC